MEKYCTKSNGRVSERSEDEIKLRNISEYNPRGSCGGVVVEEMRKADAKVGYETMNEWQ